MKSKTKSVKKSSTKKTTLKSAIGDVVVTGRATHVEPVVREVARTSIDVTRVQAAIETLLAAEAHYVEECSKIPDSGVMPQELVAVAAFADSARSCLDRVYKAFAATSEKLRTSGGTFAPGRFQVFFEQQAGKRSVAWKEEATKRAEEAAKLQGKAFDAKQYQDQVLKLTPAGPPSYKAEIREQG